MNTKEAELLQIFIGLYIRIGITRVVDD